MGQNSSKGGTGAGVGGQGQRPKNEPETFYKAKEYAKIEQLGFGAEGSVHLAVHLPTKRKVALKEVRKHGKGEERNRPPREILILSKLYHPHLIELVDWFESKNMWHMVFELADGGELLQRIVERGWYRERDAAVVSATIINAIAFLHDHHIVHRDLKTANLLFKEKSFNSPLVIVDFGISKVLEQDDQLLTTYRVGTQYYQPPEVLKKTPYLGAPFDMWNVGEIVYTLLCGFNPFFDASPLEIDARVREGTFRFPSPSWDSISELAKEFVRALMAYEPGRRLTAHQALDHPWITSNVPAPYLAWLKDMNRELARLEAEETPEQALAHEKEFAETIKRWKGFKEGVVPPEELALPHAHAAQQAAEAGGCAAGPAEGGAQEGADGLSSAAAAAATGAAPATAPPAEAPPPPPSEPAAAAPPPPPPAAAGPSGAVDGTKVVARVEEVSDAPQEPAPAPAALPVRRPSFVDRVVAAVAPRRDSGDGEPGAAPGGRSRQASFADRVMAAVGMREGEAPAGAADEREPGALARRPSSIDQLLAKDPAAEGAQGGRTGSLPRPKLVDRVAAAVGRKDAEAGAAAAGSLPRPQAGSPPRASTSSIPRPKFVDRVISAVTKKEPDAAATPAAAPAPAADAPGRPSVGGDLSASDTTRMEPDPAEQAPRRSSFEKRASKDGGHRASKDGGRRASKDGPPRAPARTIAAIKERARQNPILSRLMPGVLEVVDSSGETKDTDVNLLESADEDEAGDTVAPDELEASPFAPPPGRATLSPQDAATAAMQRAAERVSASSAGAGAAQIPISRLPSIATAADKRKSTLPGALPVPGVPLGRRPSEVPTISSASVTRARQPSAPSDGGDAPPSVFSATFAGAGPRARGRSPSVSVAVLAREGAPTTAREAGMLAPPGAGARAAEAQT